MPTKTPPSPAGQVLRGICAASALLTIVTILQYWPALIRNVDTIIFGAWLFLFMIAGMFVQVVILHYQKGKPLSEVSGSEFLIPMLFSVVVYYPIWTVAASAPHSLFSFYAAFLNGYFWRNVLGSVKSSGVKL